jgi:hypothetical protein
VVAPACRQAHVTGMSPLTLLLPGWLHGECKQPSPSSVHQYSLCSETCVAAAHAYILALAASPPQQHNTRYT